MKPVRFTLDDGSNFEIIRIDCNYVATDVVLGSEKSIFRNCVQKMIAEADSTYGTYRPIQCITPSMEDDVDYAVFLDMRKWTGDGRIRELGLLYFCPGAFLSLQAMADVVTSSCDWTRAVAYSLEDM